MDVPLETHESGQDLVSRLSILTGVGDVSRVRLATDTSSQNCTSLENLGDDHLMGMSGETF